MHTITTPLVEGVSLFFNLKWLIQCTRSNVDGGNFNSLMKSLAYAKPGRKFTVDLPGRSL